LRRAISKSALAESDLIGVWEYSLEQWDATQADKYLDELDEAIQLLAGNPELGANRDFVRKGYRVLFVNRHAIYYTATMSAVHIVRVLHEQMDPSRHL
jgi:toxin ParE1/3/4